MSATRTYTAPSGITVTTCTPQGGPDEDFRTSLHYLAWSYKSWARKIFLPMFVQHWLKARRR